MILSTVLEVELFTVQQLSELIHKKPSTIYSDLIRRPGDLPPVFRASPTSKPLFVNPRTWVMEKVRQQQALQGVGPENTLGAKSVVSQALPLMKKRGRPSNLELQKRKEEEKKRGLVAAGENHFSVKAKIVEDSRKRGQIVEQVHFSQTELVGRKGGRK